MKQTYLLSLALLIGMGAFVYVRMSREPAQDNSEAGGRTVILLKGATQFDEDHAFTRTIRKFEELEERLLSLASIQALRSGSGHTLLRVVLVLLCLKERSTPTPAAHLRRFHGHR